MMARRRAEGMVCSIASEYCANYLKYGRHQKLDVVSIKERIASRLEEAERERGFLEAEISGRRERLLLLIAERSSLHYTSFELFSSNTRMAIILSGLIALHQSDLSVEEIRRFHALVNRYVLHTSSDRK